MTSSQTNVYPETGCEFIVGVDLSENIVLVQREIRGGFQSPRPNFEGRGEFQSPRLNKVPDRVFDFTPYFSPIISEINYNERPEIISPIPKNPIPKNPKSSDNKESDPKRKSPITINTHMKNIYRETVLTDIYDDNE
jgi:hypothetical protein